VWRAATYWKSSH